MKINAIAVTSTGKVEKRELETPELTGREVLVKVHAAALCTLEQRIFKGEVKMPLPCIGGHEVAGEIAELGPGVSTQVWHTGDRVAVRLLYSCGECHQCRRGRTNMCEYSQRKPVRDGLLPGPGGICDFIIVDSAALFPVPETLSYEQAALTEPLACVVHSINRAGIALADDVVVIGGGIMGQFHVMLAKKRGARVILCELDKSRGEMAARFGADIIINPKEGDVVEKVREVTEGRGADIIFNTTPVPSVFPQAVAMAAKGGTVVQYSSIHPDTPALISPQRIHNGEISIIGSISPMVQDFYTAARLLSSGIVDCRPMIEKTFPMSRAQEAFETAIRPGTFRILLTD